MAKNKSKNVSIIDKDMAINGEVSFKGRLIIKGVVKGTVVGEILVIDKEGTVCADAKVASVVIGGIFEGDIKALDELTILSTGKCSGQIVCKNFMVEAGGILNAKITCTSQKPDDA